MPPPPSLGDDYKNVQDLTKRVADELQIPLQEITDMHHKLVDILHAASLSKSAFPINEVTLDPAKVIWPDTSLHRINLQESQQEVLHPSQKGRLCFNIRNPT